MHLVVVGVNHNTASVDVRECLAVDECRMGEMLSALKQHACISEACMVSTCNRLEIYAVTRAKGDDETLLKFLSEYSGIPLNDLEYTVYRKTGHHAIRHLFEVVCGLDSMALGETHILGQIRSAYCIASEHGTTDFFLDGLFQHAIGVGKRARTETSISCGSFSIGAAAVDLAKFVFGSLRGHKALLLGAGKMSGLAAKHLKENGIEKVFICSRTPEKVRRLVKELDGEAIDAAHIEEALCKVDVLITSTSANEPIVTKELMQRVMSVRQTSPIFIIDIAVPRDVEPEVAEIESVFLYNIDDLQFLVQRSRSDREAEVGKVNEIIEEETTAFMVGLKALEAVPVIRQLRAKFDSVYISEWEKCSAKLAHLSEKDRECVRKAIKSAVTKLTHDPILRMKDYAANDSSSKLDIVQDIFGIKEGSGEQRAESGEPGRDFPPAADSVVCIRSNKSTRT
ncbi:MAG: glutamyl-tRNA reductase [Armatimonadetes bacterium]|nr:glutamyl-tRNA reductase [Armatimonadota bacterium]